jgi:phage tail sheath gpL-like
VVTLTARCKGTLSQHVDVRLNYQQGEALPVGVAIAIVQAAVAGSGDPDLTTAITAMGDVQYDTIAMCSNVDADIEEMADELEDRWGPMEQKEGHLFVGGIGTQSILTTAGNGLNRPWVTYFESGGSVAVASGGSALEPFWAFAGMVAGIDALECSIDPARPRQTLPLPGMHPPPPASRFTRTERNTLLTDGVATHYVDDSGTMRIERLITTYQTNALSVPDPSYLDVTVMRTLAQLRWEVRTRIALRFPRSKLADDGTLFDPGQAVVTPSSIKSELISLFREWESRGLVEDFDQFKDELIVERNVTDRNRVDMRMGPNLINSFIVFAGQIQFLL